MRKLILFSMLPFLVTRCNSQGVKAIELYKLNIYNKECKVGTPDYFINGKFYDYSQNYIYTFNDMWCGVKENSIKLDLPQFVSSLDRNEFDYKILNDSVAVFFFNNFYNTMHFVNYKNGSLLKIDTLISNSKFIDNYSQKKTSDTYYEFIGGIFSEGQYYFLSAQQKGESKLFKIHLANGGIDTLKTGFGFQNTVQFTRSSRKYIIVDGSKRSIFNIVTNEHKFVLSELGYTYRLLDFINDEIIFLHHSKVPNKFALLNLRTGKSERFDLDSKVFNLNNIREEDVIRIEDGPSDGINKLKFRFFACRKDDNQILLSFADKKDNRILYLIEFKEGFLKKLN
jgi:hypothetical protein